MGIVNRTVKAIACDSKGCPRSTSFFTSEYALINFSTAAGWEITPNDKWYCPICSRTRVEAFMGPDVPLAMMSQKKRALLYTTRPKKRRYKLRSKQDESKNGRGCDS